MANYVIACEPRYWSQVINFFEANHFKHIKTTSAKTGDEVYLLYHDKPPYQVDPRIYLNEKGQVII